MESNSQNNSESWGRHYLQKVKSAFVGENKLNAVPMPEELENLVKPTPEFHINRYMEQYPQFAPRFYFIEPTSWRRDERLRGHWETEILDPGALMPMVMPKQKEPSLSVNGRYFRDKSFVPTKDPYDFTAYIARGTQMWICGAAFGVLRHLIAAFVARKRPRDSLVGWEIPRGGEGPRHLSPLAIRYNAQGTIGVRLDGADPVRKTVMSMNKRVRKMAWKKRRSTQRIWIWANTFLAMWFGWVMCKYISSSFVPFVPLKNPVTRTNPFLVFTSTFMFSLIWCAAYPAAVHPELAKGQPHDRLIRHAQSYGNLARRMGLATVFSATMGLAFHHRNLTIGRSGFGTFDRPQWSWDIEEDVLNDTVISL